MAEFQRESGDSWKQGGNMVKVSSLQSANRLEMLMEQGEQHNLSKGLHTLQGVKHATMHNHQETCLLLNITCSRVQCHKVGDLFRSSVQAFLSRCTNCIANNESVTV